MADPAHSSYTACNNGKAKFGDPHFQCTAYPMWPRKPIFALKVPANGDCSDMLNLNAVQLLLNGVCNARTRGDGGDGEEEEVVGQNCRSSFCDG